MNMAPGPETGTYYNRTPWKDKKKKREKVPLISVDSLGGGVCIRQELMKWGRKVNTLTNQFVSISIWKFPETKRQKKKESSGFQEQFRARLVDSWLFWGEKWATAHHN